MSPPLIIGCLWVLLAAATAMMPMRRQIYTGLPLLIAAPLLIGWIGYVHGWWWWVLGVAAFASMFRNPLRYLIARLRGLHPELPSEMRK